MKTHNALIQPKLKASGLFSDVTLQTHGCTVPHVAPGHDQIEASHIVLWSQRADLVDDHWLSKVPV